MATRIVGLAVTGLLFSTFVFGQAGKFNTGNGTGIPIYPNSLASEHEDDRGTVSLVAGAQAHRVAASKYVSHDKPQKVLQFYRDRLRTFGPVVECSGGENTAVDVQLTDASDATSCSKEDFAAGGTELKVIANGEQRIVVVLPHGDGAEIALVRVKQ
jgi:hypothetical protein